MHVIPRPHNEVESILPSWRIRYGRSPCPINHRKGWTRVKAITEDFLRVELRNTQPEVYYIPEGKIAAPAARGISSAAQNQSGRRGSRAEPAPAAAPAAQPVVPTVMCARSPQSPSMWTMRPAPTTWKSRSISTQLFGNVLVAQDHRIHFRGKLDILQALVVLDQVQSPRAGAAKAGGRPGKHPPGVLREMMRCDVLDEAFKNETIIGLTHAELRERSHNPQKFFGVQYMQLPDDPMAGIMRCSTSFRRRPWRRR